MNLLNECTLEKVEKKDKNFRRSTTLIWERSNWFIELSRKLLFTVEIILQWSAYIYITSQYNIFTANFYC